MKPYHCTSEDLKAIGHIREIATGFRKSRILLTAFELGIFSSLGQGRRTSRAVAEELGMDARATDRLMNALCAMGFLGKEDEGFLNSPIAMKFLVKDSPHFLSGMQHSVDLWNTWSSLTQAVRAGTSVKRREGKREQKSLEGFIAAMHQRPLAIQAASIISLIGLDDVSHMLDVGGGSGAFTFAFLRAREGLRATIFDLPEVIPITREYVERSGLHGRISLVSGDYTVDELGRDFDLVFLSQIIHSNGPETNLLLIEKCARALRQGGKLVIQDYIMDENRTTPEFGALFSLNMLVATEAGDTYTEADVRDWMERFGFCAIHKKETEMGTSLVVGIKA